MERLSINLSDYGYAQNQDGLHMGMVGMENVAALNKALEAEQITGRDTTNLTNASGAPLKVESLEKTLKHLTFRESDIRLWKDLPKKPAYNTVEEYNQQTSYGQNRGGWNREGELPEEEDSIFVRRAQLVKYLGVTKSVTHQMTLVNTMVGSVMERTIKDGTMWILRTLNQGLYFGNEKIVPEQFNGFLAQQMQSDAWGSYDEYMSSEHVVDLRGHVLTEDAIETAANSIVENYGLGTQIYGAPAVLSNFVKNFYGNKFIQPNTAALSAGVMGQKVVAFDSQFGQIGLNHDVFFKKLPSKTSSSAATSAKAPATPTWDGTTPIAIVSNAAGSKFKTGDAGNVYYAVSAINRYGESALAIYSTAPAAIVANCAVDLKFADGSGTYATTAYRIYRTKVGGSASGEFYPLFEVSVAELTAGYNGASAGLVRDKNHFLPDCEQAMLVQFDNEVVEFAQLAPLMKMDLAVLSPAFRFMILLYGTPFLYAPKKMVRFVNIGTDIS
jgi:hypothetical protein